MASIAAAVTRKKRPASSLVEESRHASAKRNAATIRQNGGTASTRDAKSARKGVVSSKKEPHYQPSSSFVAAVKHWVEKEISYYSRTLSPSEYHPNTAGKEKPTTHHLELAAAEFSRRFKAITVEEDSKKNVEDNKGAPIVLVTAAAKLDWTPPIQFSVKPEFKHVKYLLVPNPDSKTASLFISHMPSNTHGDADGHVGGVISIWINRNLLDGVFFQTHSGGNNYQPDKSIRPSLPDPTPPAGSPDRDPNSDNFPYRRLVCEVEFKNRNAGLLRTVGAEALANPYTSLFLAIKVWKKGKNGFGAVAVLWEKVPATQMIQLVVAVDFGTKRTTDAVRAKFNDPPPSGVTLLPGVGPLDWQDAQLSAGYTIPAFGLPQLPPVGSPARLTLPHSHLLHRVTYQGAPGNNPYVLGPPLASGLNAVDDLILDLNYFAYKLNTGAWPT